MIRLPLSVITLGLRDIDDFEARRQQHISKWKQDQFFLAQYEIINGDVTVSDIFSSFANSEPPENRFVETPEFSLLGKAGIQEGFDYGTVNTTLRSSPSEPEDSSTPRNLAAHLEHRLHSQVIPQSPLSFSHSTPFLRRQLVQEQLESHERLNTTGRHQPERSIPQSQVESYPANYNPPGSLLLYPPRRSGRAFRHQANSFSLDNSERANAAYDQERISSTSTTDTTPRPSNDLNLHEELQGSSLQSSRASSSAISLVQNTIADAELPSEGLDNTRQLISFSRQHSLPPPFSTIARIVSSAESLPSYERRSPRSRDGSPIPRSYRVYNDALPPDSQPQTPAQLPEARHQSRYHHSYTAPITRVRASRRVLTSPLRPLRRSDSPLGLLSVGFQGLYGGRENGDDQQHWVDGVRFDNAEIRLWD